MLLRFVGARLRVEADHRKELLGVREHLLLDHGAQLFIAGPGRVLAAVVSARSQHEIDDFVTEVLGIADARRFFDLFELAVERRAIEDFAGIGVSVLLILDPIIGIGHVTIENVLSVFGIRLEVRGLDFLADELGIACGQMLLHERKILLLHLGGELLALDLLL